MEVVIALDIEAIEVEDGGHAANSVIGLEQHWMMAVACELISNGQAHGACTKDCNTFARHGQKSRTIWL
jgi:hypothetical protein